MTEKEKIRHKESQRKWNAKNKEKIRESRRKYYLEHLEEHKEKGKKWRQENKEYRKKQSKEYYLKHKNEDKEKRKNWHKKWRLANPEKAKESFKNWRLKYPEKYKETGRNCQLKIKYNITLKQFNEMVAGQQNKCGICERTFTGISPLRPCMDHNHVTKKIRGILCENCNSSLGLMKENIKSLKNAIIWLEKNL